MNRESLILIGAGGHAKSCIDVIEQQGIYEIFGIIGLENELGKKINDYEIIGIDEDLPKFAKFAKLALVSIGQIKTPKLRTTLFTKAILAGFDLARVVSPLAYVSKTAKIGNGTIIMHRAVINSGVSIGNNCIVNSNALIEHDAQIADHCHISTGAIVNGEVKIENGCFIGSGSVIKEGVRISENSFVGMGTPIRSDITKLQVD